MVSADRQRIVYSTHVCVWDAECCVHVAYVVAEGLTWVEWCRAEILALTG